MNAGYRLGYRAPLLKQNDCRFAQSKGFRAVPRIENPADPLEQQGAVSNRIQVRPLFASKNDPSDGAETGVAEPHIAEQSRSWRAASGVQEVMRGS